MIFSETKICARFTSLAINTLLAFIAFQEKFNNSLTCKTAAQTQSKGTQVFFLFSFSNEATFSELVTVEEAEVAGNFSQQRSREASEEAWNTLSAKYMGCQFNRAGKFHRFLKHKKVYDAAGNESLPKVQLSRGKCI